MKQNKYDLESLHQRQLSLDKAIRRKKEMIQENLSTLFSPAPPSHNKIEAIVNNAQRVAAIVDGALFGYKILKSFRNFFPRRSKK